jgi:imidazolonepropionase-like amidohydrolase
MNLIAPRLLRTALLALVVCGLMPAARADIAIEHVTVLPMTRGGEVLKDTTVVIRNGRIASITPSATTKLEPTLGVLNGRDQFLLPALADMHVHVENDRLFRLYTGDANIPVGTVRTADALLPYVANGVLQIAVLSAMAETIAQRDEVESGRVLGPHMALAAMIDGTSPIWPVGMSRVAAAPADGRQAVRDAKAEGYDLIKVYERLDLETFLAIVDEARRLGMRVTGHLPQNGKQLTEQFFAPGFGMIAHAEELAQQTSPPAIDLIDEYAAWAKRNGTWLTATLTVDERIVEMMSKPETLKTRPELLHTHTRLQKMATDSNRYLQDVTPKRIEAVQRIVEFNRQLIPAFAKAGVPIVAGTDALVPGVVPGFSLHDELALLAGAGLTNRQVLESATRLPAEWLGTIDDRGEIVVGKRADLLLLDRDPLQHIENTRRIAAVFINGQFLSRIELDSRMRELRNAMRVKP